MKSTELRVGNFVSVDGKNLTVTQILEKGLNCGNVGALYELVKPIPLTEESLADFGFSDTKIVYMNSCVWMLGDDMHVTVLVNDKGITALIVYGYLKYFEHVYVHQLQNLYFALTGEELNQKKDE
jgi:hypothetical protein